MLREPSHFNHLVDRAVDRYSAKQNTPQLAAWVPGRWQNLAHRGNFRNAPSACRGDRNFQGFEPLLEKMGLHLKNKSLIYFFTQNWIPHSLCGAPVGWIPHSRCCRSSHPHSIGRLGSHLKKIKYLFTQNPVGTVYFTREIKGICTLLIIRLPGGEISKINYFIRCDHFTLQRPPLSKNWSYFYTLN